MPYNPNNHHRRSVRLKGTNYAQPGAYFVNIVTQGRGCLFGDVAVPLPQPTIAPRREQLGKPVPGSIPTIIRSYKSATTLRIGYLHERPGTAVWQRNYYEQIIRNENALRRIREYIVDNPARWNDNPENL